MTGVEMWATFGLGFVTGAAFVAERSWAYWVLCVVALLAAFVSAWRGDWLWGLANTAAVAYWGCQALKVEPRAAA